MGQIDLPVSAPTVQKETLWIDGFRRHCMKKKILSKFEGCAGRKITCFSIEGAGDFYCISIHTTQPWETNYLTLTLVVRLDEFISA